MSGWQSVARKDFNDAVRSRRLLSLVVLFVLFICGTEYLLADVLGSNISSVEALIISLAGPTTLMVPLIGLVTGYRSIASERESGSHKLLLSLPHTRRDVVLGKLAGRTAVVSAAITSGFFAGGVLALGLLGSFDASLFLGYYALTLLYAAAFVSLGVGVSAATGSTNVAVMGSFGAFAVFQFLWVFLVGVLQMLVPSAPDESFEFLVPLSPLVSYGISLFSFLGESSSSGPFYETGWFALFVLVSWVVVPSLLGYLRFRSVDL